MSERVNLALASVALFVVVVADVVTTLMFRARGIPESNPLVSPWVDHTASFVAVKVGTAIMFTYGLSALTRHVRGNWMARWVWAGTGLLAVAVTLNIGALT